MELYHLKIYIDDLLHRAVGPVAPIAPVGPVGPIRNFVVGMVNEGDFADVTIEENGMDVDEMSMNELEEASEVFALPNGQYLIVEG